MTDFLLPILLILAILFLIHYNATLSSESYRRCGMRGCPYCTENCPCRGAGCPFRGGRCPCRDCPYCPLIN